jgi:phosphonate transport system permease protein
MSRPASAWELPRPFGIRSLLVLFIVIVVGFFAGPARGDGPHALAHR